MQVTALAEQTNSAKRCVTDTWNRNSVGKWYENTKNSVTQFYEENKTAISIVGGAAVAAGAIAAAVYAGDAVIAFLAVAAKSAAKYAGIGAIVGTTVGTVDSALDYMKEHGTIDGSTDDVLSGMKDGLINGAIAGGIYGFGKGGLDYIKSSIALKKAGSSAKGLIGYDFEDYLSKNFGGEGSFSVGGREFDGGIGNRWWEAKSGNYWNMLEENPNKLAKFKSDIGDRLRIATENDATYEIFSNIPIPESIKQWLTKKGIAFTELLD